MNQKELNELRRRFRPDRSAISQVYGCYVNGSGEIISYIDSSLGAMPQEESEKYLCLLKKTLTGTLGKHLIDIVFDTRQVADSEEHRLLMGLRDSGLGDSALRQAFYEKAIHALDLEGSNYLILMGHDVYDVPYRGKDGEDQADGGDQVFSYFVCCVCPVKDGKPELGYFPGENEFHSCTPGQIVSQPELGFLFPAFDDRAANIYNALFYARKPEQLHQEFIDAVFRTEPPMSAAEQKEAFEGALTEALGEKCSLELVQAVHQELRARIEAHKESHDPEPLALTARELGGILTDCGADEGEAQTFLDKCGERFGAGAVLSPANLIDSRRFEVKTEEVVLNIDPERSALIETRVIDGRKYILIPADGEVSVNGISVDVTGA